MCVSSAYVPPTYQLSATLETHEVIDPSLAVGSVAHTQKHTRQVYATHHESTLDTQQTSVLLTVPSGATPSFSTSGVQLAWSVHVSLLTQTGEERVGDERRTCVPPPHWEAVPDAYAAFHTSYGRTPTLATPVDEGGMYTKLEVVECSVPLSVLPNSSKSQTVPVVLYA